ncbi:MAG TPA: HAMP domain-containing sensor histidine kinase [Candidatus Saccharimonadales bacterium]|jgi:two-component system C4-dicarboxylate transport sensor histidine kinase DctB|nr:HAMP domain-containing sensor histidine kinase [Candidatus Saccharimonadales bacterium]
MNVNDLQLSELRRFAELGRVSATLIHEISNPLTAALINLELGDSTSPGVRQARHNMQLLRRYVESARQQFRSSSPVTSFTLASQISQLNSVLMPLAKRSHVQLDIGTPNNVSLLGNPLKFQQIITNLAVNAIQAYKEPVTESRPSVVRLRFSHTSDSLTITITDWGEGIAPSQLNQVFEPFYTTKNYSGLGMGLAIVKQYVTDDFGGTISVCSSVRLGTKFTIRLPLSHKPLVLK